MKNCESKTVEHVTDWLASDTIFYNEKTLQVGHNINDVIDFRNLEFDAEGLNNYLDFGYCVLEQTPVKNVRFLPHSSRLTFTNRNEIKIENLTDQAEDAIRTIRNEKEVIELLKSKIQDWENSVSGDIVIPTSGGYDSRLLNLMIADKSKIRSFTYGISSKQNMSYEVIYAKKISEILNTKWEQIPLGWFHNYFDEWDNLFGISTHAHGMYQVEFYKEIAERVNSGTALLSGIIGDAWAGSVKIPKLTKPEDVLKLGYSHGIKAESKQSLLKADNVLLYQYYEKNRYKLQDPSFRVIESMRFKIILLCYLLRVPEKLAFKPWSPFLDLQIAIAMLSLPPERRHNRVWQTEYFRNHNLDLESMNLKFSIKNNLDKQALCNIPLKPLDINLLREVIRPGYLEWINRNILLDDPSIRFKESLMNVPKLGGMLKRIGWRDNSIIAYNAYLTLKPIEYLIRKRNKA